MIYFVRHGATDWNDFVDENGKRTPRCQGTCDIPLNERGITQAKETAKQLKNIKFDRIICSPLTRAIQTCDIVYQGDKQIEIDRRLTERDFGEFEGLTRDEFDFNGFWNKHSNQNYKKAESVFRFRDRVVSLLNELSKQPDKNILLVSHGGVGCILMEYFDGEPENGDYLSFEIPNGKPIIKDFNQKTLS